MKYASKNLFTSTCKLKVRIKTKATRQANAPTMEDTQTDTPPNKLEVVEMLGVHSGSGGNLECVIIMRRILRRHCQADPQRGDEQIETYLEETVERVEHLVREKEEVFSRNTSVVQALIRHTVSKEVRRVTKPRLTGSPSKVIIRRFLRSFGVCLIISAYESSKMCERRILIWQLPA